MNGSDVLVAAIAALPLIIFTYAWLGVLFGWMAWYALGESVNSDESAKITLLASISIFVMGLQVFVFFGVINYLIQRG